MARLALVILLRDCNELPAALEKKIWNQPVEGLLITSALTLLVANLFDLSGISTMGSSGFLIIFAAVNLANARLHRQTKSIQWISLLGVIVCIAALVILLTQTARQNPQNLLVVVVMVGLAFAIEIIYRQFTNRQIQLHQTNKHS